MSNSVSGLFAFSDVILKDARLLNREGKRSLIFVTLASSDYEVKDFLYFGKLNIDTLESLKMCKVTVSFTASGNNLAISEVVRSGDVSKAS